MKIKHWLFLDFETYYDAQYSLRKMTVPEYLLDARYETILCACAVDLAPSQIVDGPNFGQWLHQFDPTTTATVTFNALFDNAILAWHYGFVPALMMDSMNMARALRGHILPKLNLSAVGDALKTPHRKQANVIQKVSGARRQDIIARGLWHAFSDYANEDNETSRDIWKILIKEFPVSERRVMDLVIRAAVEPKFHLDKPLLQKHLTDVRANKDSLMAAAGNSNRQTLLSTAHFQKALEDLSIDVQYKTSPTGNKVPAFAKTDAFMEELQNHFDPRVQALACARLGIKSTIEETRTEKLIAIGALNWQFYRDGNPRVYSGGEMPVPLRYAGAHTHRLSGDWRLNMQNMPRGSQLRHALIAPPGCVVIAGDLAQIEARLVAWLAGCSELLAEFAKPGGDPYSAFASIVFGFQVDKKKHPIHRFIGKTGVLGLGYQCGADKFFSMVAVLARLASIDIAQALGQPWTREIAEKIVWGYRNRYHQIKRLWGLLQQATRTVWLNQGSGAMRVGPAKISHGEIEGPGGLKMLYADPREEQHLAKRLRLNKAKSAVAMDFSFTIEDNPARKSNHSDGSRMFVYDYGWGRHLMYGGKMLENIIQFLARIIIMNAAIRMSDQGYNFALQAHDEVVYIVPKTEESHVLALLYRELTAPPSWGPDIPLNAEVKSGPSYGAAK